MRRTVSGSLDGGARGRVIETGGLDEAANAGRQVGEDAAGAATGLRGRAGGAGLEERQVSGFLGNTSQTRYIPRRA